MRPQDPQRAGRFAPGCPGEEQGKRLGVPSLRKGEQAQRTGRQPLSLIPLFLLLILSGCGREEVQPQAGGATAPLAPVEKVQLLLKPEERWVPTGIVIARGFRYRITGQDALGAAPLGSPYADFNAPISTYGPDGLIGKVGEKGIPFPIPSFYELDGSSLSEGKMLFVGRNIPPQGLTIPATPPGVTYEIITAPYTPLTYTVEVGVFPSNSPALLAPIDRFFDRNPNPVFEWDQLNNAAQYLLEISDFSDFRRIIFNLNVNTTSANTGLIGISFPNPNTVAQGPNLSEGVYYWRVKAQINRGRLFSPDLVWSDYSVPFILGVETESPLPPPILLNPTVAELRVAANTVLPVEFLARPDASGIFWRFLAYGGTCGEAVTADDPGRLRFLTPWQVFEKQFQRNRINEPPLLYGFFLTPLLTQGQWLIRIATRDGVDDREARLGVLDLKISAGCSS